jgi:ribosomal protein S12 methylthiotransferase
VQAILRRRGEDSRWITGHTALVTATLPRRRLTPRHYAYVKIAEGCDRTCTFCAIPAIRGRLRSRTQTDVLAEARSLAAEGVREVVLVSQETTAYGADLGDPHALVRLLEGLLTIDALRWVRLHYLYPTRISPELLRLLGGEPRLCRYLDLPLQHCDGAILKAMGRGGTERSLRRLLDRVRDGVPDITIRTSFITGFPGETSRQFARLLAFVEAVRFDRVGVFRYSDEEGTAAAALRPKVPRRTAEARRARLMAAQARIAEAKGRSWLGTVQQVVVDGPSADFPDVQCGRTARHAPEVDGTVYLRGPKAAPGTLVQARILEAFEHDLTAEIVETVEGPWPAAHR